MGLKFSDGMEFDTSGPLRVITKSDGDYVIGQGMLIPVSSPEEGQQIIDKMKGKTSAFLTYPHCQLNRTLPNLP